MDFALNNLQILICHKIQQTKPNYLLWPMKIFPTTNKKINTKIKIHEKQ